MKKIFLIVLSILFILSCGNEVKKFDSEYLATIEKNKLYSTVISLPEGYLICSRLDITVSPANIDFNWKTKDNKPSLTLIKNCDKIVINVISYTNNDIYIDFNWEIPGTNIRTGRKFQKRYILKVKKQEGINNY